MDNITILCVAVIIGGLCIPSQGFLSGGSKCSPACENSGTCEWSIHGHYCKCYNGYQGGHCEISHCSSQPCQHGGTCTHRTFGYRCHCRHGYTGTNCQHPPHTTALPTTVAPTTKATTTKATTTTQAPSTTPSTTTGSPPSTTATMVAMQMPEQSFDRCSKFTTIFDVAESVIEENVDAPQCPSGSPTSPEALPMNLCGISGPSTWSKGIHVMDNCDILPHYTPVATFTNDVYNHDNSMAGVFVGCLTDEDGILVDIMPNEWKHGIFGCFDNCGLCIITWLVPCYTFGKNAEAVGENCLMYGLLMMVPIVNLILAIQLRGKLREKYDITGGVGDDIFRWFCCGLWALIQEGQEVAGAAPQGMAIERV